MLNINIQSPFSDRVTTEIFARAIGRSAQTIRKNFCLAGDAYGIKPQKVGGRLLWPTSEIEKLLAGEVGK